MPYDRGGLTILPNIGSTGTAYDGQVTFIAAAGDIGQPMTMPCKGRVLGLAIQATAEVKCATTQGVLGIDIGTAPVMTVGLTDNQVADTWVFTLGTLVSGQNAEFAAGEVLQATIVTKGLEGGAEAGAGMVFMMVSLDQGP